MSEPVYPNNFADGEEEGYTFSSQRRPFSPFYSSDRKADPSEKADRIIEASPDVLSTPIYLPCPTCTRTFVESAFDRHVNICEKVSSKKKIPVNAERKKIKDPIKTTPVTHKRQIKPSEEFFTCKYCERKFGNKAFDRHEAWCEERSRRMQLSPNKDMVALAKLHMRTTYRPKTPIDSHKNEYNYLDFESEESKYSKNKKSATGISSLYSTDHVRESEDTHFVRAATGRGSIKNGPAQTKASQLRQLKNESVAKPENEFIYKNNKNRSVTPSMSRSFTSMDSSFNNTPTLQRSYSSRGRPSSKKEYLVRPNVLRPIQKRSEPEGIEMNGGYDHIIEYDPYQLAANQMNELLFGNSASPLKPSSNSAFQKYVPNAKQYNNEYLPERNDEPLDRKVAKFCHECGNEYPLPSIRFCCQCGIKRLYC